MKRFKDKVVVVTGAGGGIGRAHALGFAAQGAKVVVNDLGGARDGSGGNNSMADKVVDEIRAAGGTAVASYDSVSDPEGAQRIINKAREAFGRIDVLVNNAGILRDKTLLKITDAEWRAVIETHLTGTFLCSRAAARAMAEQGEGGRIVNTSSVAGLKGNFGQTNYAAAKAGIYGMTLVHAQELQKHRITVNAIAPIAKTRLTEELNHIPDELKAEHITPLVMFLASPEAEAVNGRVFGVHGRHLFEYKMTTTDGVRGESDWTVDAILAALPRIEGGAPAAAVAPSPAPAAAPSADTPQGRLAGIFERMPKGFLPDKAGSWNAVMHFAIAGAGDYTLEVKDGAAQTKAGLHGSPTCVVKSDAATFLGMVDGVVDGQQAFMQGKVTATNISDLMKYRTSFSKEKAAAAAAPSPTPAAAVAAAAPSADTPQGRLAGVFERMPKGFLPDKAGSWKAVMHFAIAGAGDYTLEVKDGGAQTKAGLHGSPTCLVKSDAATFLGMVDGVVDGQQAFMQGKVTATNISDLMKYRTSFSKEKAAAAAPTAGATPAAAPAAAAPAVNLDPEDLVSTVLEHAGDLLAARPEPVRLRFELPGTTWGLTWDAKGARAERDPAADAGAGRVVTDVATLAGFLDGSLDAKDAVDSMRLVTTRMRDLAAWAQGLRGPALQGRVAELLARRPVSATPELRAKTFHGAPAVLTAADARAYADATSDPNPAYGRGAVPPVMAVRYHIGLSRQVLTDPGVKADLMRLVHGEQEIVFHQPLRVGDVVSPKVRLERIEHKSSGSLMHLKFRILRDGELVNETTASYFVRAPKDAKGDGKGDGKATAKSGPEAFGKVDFERAVTVAPDQSRRYAEASLDRNPIHTDEGIAKAAGFPGVILHGLCTLAFASQAVVQGAAGGDPERLRSIRARFSKPVLMGDVLTTRGRLLEERGGERQVAFEVVNQSGAQVITGGLAVVRSR